MYRRNVSVDIQINKYIYIYRSHVGEINLSNDLGAMPPGRENAFSSVLVLVLKSNSVLVLVPR